MIRLKTSVDIFAWQAIQRVIINCASSLFRHGRARLLPSRGPCDATRLGRSLALPKYTQLFMTLCLDG